MKIKPIGAPVPLSGIYTSKLMRLVWMITNAKPGKFYWSSLNVAFGDPHHQGHIEK